MSVLNRIRKMFNYSQSFYSRLNGQQITVLLYNMFLQIHCRDLCTSIKIKRIKSMILKNQTSNGNMHIILYGWL